VTALLDPSAAEPMIGVMTAAETAQTAALGPCTRCREVPNSGYAMRAAKAV
jgi:hypothetical protein